MSAIYKNKDIYLYISIILISIFFAISQTTIQIAIEAPLYINGNIRVDQINPWSESLVNQYSLIIQLINRLPNKIY